ncbi:hypothetical protein HPB51_020594 [Rhipicephalus microplus]|uniref:Uncharacterized protein n=1 Tax=Rhipicephalus microplus TaxID=6941 RepID=A0A9J6DJE0_RHIMP|nr:hypothetical protein HPB51_020594 [Rhipicephalus microplus]
MWRIGMIKKSELEIYRTFKQEIATERIYDITQSSSLLFEARTGVLQDKTYRAKYEECSAFTCSWPVTGPHTCLDKLTIPSRRLPGHPNTSRAPVLPQAGPPGPFKSTKRRGATLSQTGRNCSSAMQRPAQHWIPTTIDALSVIPASSSRTTDTAVPPLSTSGNVNTATIQQQTAFFNSVHSPASGVSATPSFIATHMPELESRNVVLELQSTTPAARPTVSASGLPIGISESVDKRVSTSIVPFIVEVLPSITSADDSSTKMDGMVAGQRRQYAIP